MGIGQIDVEEFFRRYGEALVSRDAQRIAGFWGLPALVVTDDTVIAVATAAEVEAFFAASMAQYEAVAAVHPSIEAVVPVSRSVAGCEIAWDHHDAAGKAIGREEGFYLLRAGETLKIHQYTPRAE